MKYSEYLKKVIKSRLGLLLAIFNWLLFSFLYFTRESRGQTIHLYNESIFFQIVVIINIPAITVAGLVVLLLGYNDSIGERYWITKPVVLLCFVFAITIQWLIIGYGIEKWLSGRKSKLLDEH